VPKLPAPIGMSLKICAESDALGTVRMFPYSDPCECPCKVRARRHALEVRRPGDRTAACPIKVGGLLKPRNCPSTQNLGPVARVPF
jgi:hypothetical protein